MTKKDLKNLVRIRLDYFRKVMTHLGRARPDSFVAARLQELQPQILIAVEASERGTDLERAGALLMAAYQAADLLLMDAPDLATRGVIAVEAFLDETSTGERVRV